MCIEFMYVDLNRTHKIEYNIFFILNGRNKLEFLSFSTERVYCSTNRVDGERGGGDI